MNTDGIDLGVSGSWVETLPEFQKSTIEILQNFGKTSEEITDLWMHSMGPATNSPFGGPGNALKSSQLPSYFEAVSNEITKLLCGSSEYADTRSKIQIYWIEKKSLALGIISAAVASTLGLVAAAITPIIALALDTASKVGINAWCASKNISP